MKEYKVCETNHFFAEREMNYMATSGWKVISVIPIEDKHSITVMITYERDK